MMAVFRSKAFAARVRKLTGVSGTKLAPVLSRWDSKGCWEPGVMGMLGIVGVVRRGRAPRTECARLRDAKLASGSRTDEAERVCGRAPPKGCFHWICIPDYG